MASPQLAPDGLQVNATQSDLNQDAQYLSGYMGRKMEVGGPLPASPLPWASLTLLSRLVAPPRSFHASCSDLDP